MSSPYVEPGPNCTAMLRHAARHRLSLSIFGVLFAPVEPEPPSRTEWGGDWWTSRGRSDPGPRYRALMAENPGPTYTEQPMPPQVTVTMYVCGACSAVVANPARHSAAVHAAADADPRRVKRQ